MSKTIPIWLPDDRNSGVLTSWFPLERYVSDPDVVFVSDAENVQELFRARVISVAEFLKNSDNYTLPILNLGTSMEYMKQLDFLFKKGGFIFFHQLFLHRLIENFYIRNGKRDVASLARYGEVAYGKIGKLLAEIGAMNGLEFHEYYLKTFAVQVAEASVGFCSAWKGAANLLASESSEANDILEKSFYLPPPFDVDLRRYAVGKAAHQSLKLALVGHKNMAKQPEFCMETVRFLNNMGISACLVGIGSIGDYLIEHRSKNETEMFEKVEAPEHEDFVREISKCDFIFHFRKPFGGEMPLTVCECMAVGVPPIGYKADWLMDIPSEAWVGLDVGVSPKEAAEEIRTRLSVEDSHKSIIASNDSFVIENGSGTKSAEALTNIFSFLRNLQK